MEVEERLLSNPPALDVTSHTLRERLPYPVRTMDEMTSWADYPLRQHNISAPVTWRELFAARRYDGAPNWGWPCWADENRPQQTPWIGYDNSNFRIYGGQEAPDETAAVASNTVMQSIEAESDPLVAQRQAADANQRVIRRRLSEGIEMEDENRELMRQVEVLTDNRDAYLRTRDETQTRLETVERERDGLRTELDRAQTHIERLQQQIYEPAGELRRRQVEREAHEDGLRREAELRERVRVLEQSEATLTIDLTSETARADRLQTAGDQIAYEHEGLEMERNHYWEERDGLTEHNRALQAQMQTLTAQLTAAQALAMQPQANVPTVNAPPNIAAPMAGPPVVVQPPVVAHAAAPARGGRRGRGRGGARGRGRRGAAAVATRA